MNTRSHKSHPLLIILACTISLQASRARSESWLTQGHFRLVATSGDLAPIENSDLEFKSFRNASINEHQQVTFSAFLENNDVGVFGENSGQLSTFLVEGQSMPRAGGGTSSFYSLSTGAIYWNDAGRIVADGYVSSSDNGMAIGDTQTGFEMVTISGQTPPGQPANIEFAWIDRTAINNAGEVAAYGLADGFSCGGPCEFAKWGFWRHTPSEGLTEVAISGETGADGRTFSLTSGRTQFTQNDAGTIVIRGVRDLNNGTLPDQQTIWRYAEGQLSALVKDGDVAPVPGNPTFWSIQSPAIDAAGNVAFEGSYSYGSGGGGQGIWMTDGNTITPVAHDWQPVANTDLFLYQFFTGKDINSHGTVAFRSELRRSGDTRNTSNGVFKVALDGDLETIALKGDAATVLADGVVFDSLSGPTINDDETMLFSATLQGPGITEDNDRSYWIYDDEGLHLIAREGDMIQLAANDQRQIQQVGFDAGGSSEGHSAVNGLGPGNLSAMVLYFTDGTQAVVAVSPELHSADFDIDGDIDGSDLLWWQRGFSESYSLDHLSSWQLQYGTHNDVSSTLTNIPEPSSLLLAVTMSLVPILASQRHKQLCPHSLRVRNVHLDQADLA